MKIAGLIPLLTLCMLYLEQPALSMEEEENQEQPIAEHNQSIDNILNGLAEQKELSEDQIQTIHVLLVLAAANRDLGHVAFIIAIFSRYLTRDLVLLIMERQRTILKANIESPELFQDEIVNSFNTQEQPDQSYNTPLLEEYFALCSEIPYSDFANPDNYQDFIDILSLMYEQASKLSSSDEKKSEPQAIIEDLLTFITLNINHVCNGGFDKYLDTFSTCIVNQPLIEALRGHVYIHSQPDLTPFLQMATPVGPVFTGVSELFNNSTTTTTSTSQSYGEEVVVEPPSKKRKIEKEDESETKKKQ